MLATTRCALQDQAQAAAYGPVHPHTADGGRFGAPYLKRRFFICSSADLFVRCNRMLAVSVRQELTSTSAVTVCVVPKEFNDCVCTDLGAYNTSGIVVLYVSCEHCSSIK